MKLKFRHVLYIAIPATILYLWQVSRLGSDHWLKLLAASVVGSAIGFFCYFLERSYRQYKKNKSTSQSGAWTVCLNGNRVGEISKAQHTSTCQTARNDHQLAIRQGFNYCMMVCNAILASLGTTLLLLFSVVIALTISESEQTYSLLIEFFQKSTAADLSYFAKNLLSMILVVSMTYWQ